jgi:hypothetical protein
MLRSVLGRRWIVEEKWRSSSGAEPVGRLDIHSAANSWLIGMADVGHSPGRLVSTLRQEAAGRDLRLDAVVPSAHGA